MPVTTAWNRAVDGLAEAVGGAAGAALEQAAPGAGGIVLSASVSAGVHSLLREMGDVIAARRERRVDDVLYWAAKAAGIDIRELVARLTAHEDAEDLLI